MVQLEKGVIAPPSAAARPTHETFEWVIEPPCGIMQGIFYTDGSRLYAEISQSAARLGWAFTVIGPGGDTVAEARGIPPP